MKRLIKNAHVFYEGAFVRHDILISGGIISDIGSNLPQGSGITVYNMNNCFVFPGLIDVHVHLREPGFSYKETVASGTLAAARGGFTAVCAMPNLDPVPDSPEHLEKALEMIRRGARVHVFPYASITVGEKQTQLVDMEALASNVLAFSDDGVGVQSGEMMESAMRRAKKLNKIIAAHCEIAELVNGGCIHDGDYAKKHGLKGISSESEWREVERDLELAEKTGCDFHICHVSTKESVALIRRAKARGVNVTCETAPHYLVFCEDDLRDEGAFRMNPPLRSAEDKAALIEGILDGTIDMIATDHAPHSAEEKSRGLEKSLNGVVGLETAFPVLYTELVKTGVITLEKLIALMHIAPGGRFGLGGKLTPGARADLTVFELDTPYEINPENFLSKGRATPFAGRRVYGRCLMTLLNGEPVWEDALCHGRCL